MIAFEAVANKTSDSEIPPAVERITLTLTPSTSIFSSEALTASAVPCTSALTIIFKSSTSPSLICENKSSKDIAAPTLRSLSNFAFKRDSPTLRACFSLSKTMNLSPATGTSFNPVISTGVAGKASLITFPRSSNI